MNGSNKLIKEQRQGAESEKMNNEQTSSYNREEADRKVNVNI